MQQFSAYQFFHLGGHLEALKLLYLDVVNLPVPAEALHVKLVEATKDKALTCLRQLGKACKVIDLNVTAHMVNALVAQIEKDGSDYSHLMCNVQSIQHAIQGEMEQKAFFHMPPESAKYWPTQAKPNLFGDDVAAAFPSAVHEINLAGVAMAVQLFTASVFHQMRALEVGLRALTAKFNITLTHTNWGPVIDQLESQINQMHNDPAWNSLPDFREQEVYYSQAASHFRIIKNAWRNHTMHGTTIYGEADAIEIFGAVKAFMKKLAEKLKE